MKPALHQRTRSGMTLIEMVIVITLLGILFSITAVSVNALTPIYRLRSASRTVGAQVEELRALAVSVGRPLGLRYLFTDEIHGYQLIPPAPEEFPDEPLESRELGVKTDLPHGVRIRQIVLPGGRAAKPPGAISCIFSPMGNTGSHVVTLETDGKGGQQLVLSMKFNAITGAIDFVDGETDFQHHED